MRGIAHPWARDYGGACHFGGSMPSTTTQSTTSSPWEGQKPYLTGDPASGIQGVFPTAAALYNNNAGWPQYFPTSTYSGLTPGQQSFINGSAVYGSNLGNSGINAANSNLTNTLGSGYTAGASTPFNAANNYLTGMIGGNTLDPFKAPGFQNVINGTLANVIPATTSSFINGGRADSGLAQNAATSAATNAIGSLANQNYLQEQGLQQGAAGQAANNLLTQQGNQIKGLAIAPGIDQSQLGDLMSALQTQGMVQQNNQNLLNYDVGKWNYNQSLPFNMLGQYQNYVGGTGYGGTTTGQSTQPYYSNTGANIMSGISGAVGIASALPGLIAAL